MTLAQPIEARVDEDLAAYRRGPATLGRRLDELPAAEVAARYRALIARVEIRASFRRRDGDESLARTERAAERADLLRRRAR